MAFQEQQGAISSNTAPNYDVSAKPGWDTRPATCVQGHSPDKDTLQTEAETGKPY
uniref:Uncharacterized protein n=1 Tax=Trichinella nativa TaxID=6335 RepID=A0A0V1KI32_9BILA